MCADWEIRCFIIKRILLDSRYYQKGVKSFNSQENVSATGRRPAVQQHEYYHGFRPAAQKEKNIMQVGEKIAAIVMKEIEGKCPFCDSIEAEPNLEKLEIRNDSHELGEKTPGPYDKVIKNPESTIDYYIKNRYWRFQRESVVAMNAHHIIPGNASLAKVASLLKWLAAEVVIEKKFYKKSNKVKAKIVKHDGIIVTTTASSWRSKKGYHQIIQRTESKENKVTGKVGPRPDGYNINCLENGIWLPSNNAIDGWSKMASEPGFQKTYAERAMDASWRQFHDAHPDYSDQVKEQLEGIAKKLETKSKACIKDCKKSQNDPFPAPRRLYNCLIKLSTEIKMRTLAGKRKYMRPWITSRFSNEYKPKKVAK